MGDHMQVEDYELWDIITDGSLSIVKKNAEGNDVPKTRANYNAEDLKKWEKNAQEISCKIKYPSKERLSELLLELIDESEDVNNEKEQLLKECVILKAKCKNLKLRACETENENIILKNQLRALDTTVLELKSENIKLKLGTSKEIASDRELTLEGDLGKVKDELYKRDDQVQVKESSQIWFMDSGFSKHMTGSKNRFLSLADLKGYGLKYSLINVSQLCDRGNMEQDDEEIGLTRNSNGETTFQPKTTSRERIGDETGFLVDRKSTSGAMVLWGDESTDREESVEIGGSGSGDTTAAEGLKGNGWQEEKGCLFYPSRDSSHKRKNYKELEEAKLGQLEKALPESAKKAAAKGKKNDGQTSEEIQIEEMDLVLHDEDEAEEVEVVTPTSKKIKTSEEKSPEKSVKIEESALFKRTRYARKSRKVQIVEEESEEEETDE
uniref:Uncharacterized protein n=1 Tax=Nicotiana tabacum TaxID=4097 RepID=A0A1S3YPW3_TOBAC|nr:PREDICTED: uncharacterized protein LOC107778358 [Nicotiana tabacum]